jgi:hypothetical protein
VLFAVVVLGIGFIMVAAIFPVAISQSKATADEVAAAGVARSGVSIMTNLVDNKRDLAALGLTRWADMMPVIPIGAPGTIPGDVAPINTHYGWRMLRGNMIFRDDPRYAFVPLYRRGQTLVSGAPQPNATAQIYIIGVQCRATDRDEVFFDQRDVSLNPTPPYPSGGGPAPSDADMTALSAQLTTNPNNLTPRRILIQLQDVANDVDLIKVNRNPAGASVMTENLPDAVAQGAYVIVAGTGNIYRVGTRREDLEAPSTPANTTHFVYELQPGNDLRDATENQATDVAAWCIGRERRADGTFAGPAQDISIYTALVPVNP